MDVNYYQYKYQNRELKDIPATPKALQDYNDDNATVVDGAISTEVQNQISASTDLTVGGHVIISGESCTLRKSVDRMLMSSEDMTTPQLRNMNMVQLSMLNALDDALIEFSDDFGFSETSSFFTDGGSDENFDAINDALISIVLWRKLQNQFRNPKKRMTSTRLTSTLEVIYIL